VRARGLARGSVGARGDWRTRSEPAACASPGVLWQLPAIPSRSQTPFHPITPSTSSFERKGRPSLDPLPSSSSVGQRGCCFTPGLAPFRTSAARDRAPLPLEPALAIARLETPPTRRAGRASR
jgi:hypothetical protein